MFKVLNGVFLYLDKVQGVSKVLCSQGVFLILYILLTPVMKYIVSPCFAETVFLEQSLWTCYL